MLDRIIQFQQQIVAETSSWTPSKRAFVGSFIIFIFCYILLRILIRDRIKTTNSIIEESNMWIKTKLSGQK